MHKPQSFKPRLNKATMAVAFSGIAVPHPSLLYKVLEVDGGSLAYLYWRVE